MPGETLKVLNHYAQDVNINSQSLKIEKGVLQAIRVLKTYSASVHFFTKDHLNIISVAIPVSG